MSAPSRSFDWIVPAGEGMAHIPVPFDQRAVFGSARPPVEVTVNGYSYRSTIAIMRGQTFVPLPHEPRKLVHDPWADDRLCHLDPQGGGDDAA